MPNTSAINETGYPRKAIIAKNEASDSSILFVPIMFLLTANFMNSAPIDAKIINMNHDAADICNE